MNTSPAQEIWTLLQDLVANPGHEELAEVSRLISFRPYESYGPHRHRRIEINYVKKGNCILRLADGSTSFKRDEIMIIASDTEHSFEAGSDGTTLVQLEFQPDIFGPAGEPSPPLSAGENRHDRNGPTGVIRIVHNIRITNAVQRIVNELNQRKEHHRSLVLLYYTELLILLRRYMAQTYLPLGSDPAMQTAISYLRSHFAEPISLSEVAARAGISSRYLRKLFDRYLNLSPLEYLTQLRIDRAIELLRNTDLSIKEVSFACGFRSPQYFARIFRRQIGRPPKSLAR